jgi:hypothetical protein
MKAHKAVIDMDKLALPIFYKEGHIRDCIKKARNLIYADGILQFLYHFKHM